MNTNYRVFWVAPTTDETCLLGGANTIAQAEEIAANQMRTVAESPFMDTKTKYGFIKSIYIYDCNADYKLSTVNLVKLQNQFVKKCF